jgi:integral membrane protein
VLKTPIGRLRAIGLVEGVSYLVLLGIAMPLKYFAGIPMAVKIVGWTHGLLFVLFCTALAHVMLAVRWSIGRGTVVFIASLVPLGTFLIDPRLKREDEQLRGPLSAAHEGPGHGRRF